MEKAQGKGLGVLRGLNKMVAKTHFNASNISKAIDEAIKNGDFYAGLYKSGKTVKIVTDRNKARLTAFLKRLSKSKDTKYYTKFVNAKGKKR